MNPRTRRTGPTRLERFMGSASAGCTAFLLGALAVAVLLLAISLRG